MTKDTTGTGDAGAVDPVNGAAADDVAYQRVQAADPAAQASPDLAAIDAVVRDRLAEVDENPETSAPQVSPRPAPDADELPDELQVVREKRRRRLASVRIAATVAGALVIGGGGYALGTAGGGQDGGSTAEAPIVLGSAPAAADSAAGGAAAGGSQELAIAPGAGMSTRSADSSLAYGGGHTVFHAEGLSTDGGSAQAWALDAAAVFSEDTVRSTAKTLGVAGEPRQEYGAWVVGSADGTGPNVNLQPDGLANLSFYNSAVDPGYCMKVMPVPSDVAPEGATSDQGTSSDGGGSSSGSSGAATDPSTGCDPADQGAAPSKDAAVSQMKDLLSSLGVDVTSYQFETPEWDTGTATTPVVANQVIADQRTGITWSATFAEGGLLSLYGSLAPAVPLGDYDVVSPAEAVERLNDPRFGGGMYGPIAYAQGGIEDMAGGVASDPAMAEPEIPTVPPTAAAGDPIGWPVQDVTISSARLGLAVFYQPDGAGVLLPAYELTDAQGASWSTIAVVDDQLDFAPQR